MRTLNYKKEYQKLLSPEIVSFLAQIHEQKGQQNLFIEAHKDALSELLEIAKIQSTEASNRIEGIITTDDRLKKIVLDNIDCRIWFTGFVQKRMEISVLNQTGIVNLVRGGIKHRIARPEIFSRDALKEVELW